MNRFATQQVLQLAAAAALALSTPVVLHAQTRSLTWSETTRTEMGGSLGTIMRLSGGNRPLASRNGLHIQGKALIQEVDSTATIMDLDKGTFTMVDHANRTYTTVTFEQMAQMTREAIASAQAGAAGAPAGAGGPTAADRAEAEQAMRDAQARVEFRVNAEATGQRQRIGTHDASQHFVTTQFEATAVPEGVEQRDGGSLLFLAEMWQTDDVPRSESLLAEWGQIMAADPRLRSMGEETAAASRDANGAMAQSLSTWNPEVGAGLLRMAEEMKKVTGTTIRSITTVAMVPLGATYQRADLIAWQPGSTGDQARAGANTAANSAANSAAAAAAGAVRGALGGLGGLGRGRNQAPPPAAAPAPAAEPARTVQPLMRITTDRENIAYRESRDDVLGALNARIAGYTARTGF